jgi:hypothetical protein
MIAADHHLLAVADRVDVDLDGVVDRKRSSSTGASFETGDRIAHVARRSSSS